MDAIDMELLESLSAKNPDLKALRDEHILFESQIAMLEEKSILTPAEETRLKELKKQKLEGKTRLHALLEQYRNEA